MDSIPQRLSSYLAMDRRRAIASGVPLAARCEGAVLFADISGFTEVTEELVLEHGSQRGADALTEWLNRAFELLIEQVHRFRGSVIGFSGDAITCWFEGDRGQRAIGSALYMQGVLAHLEQDRSISGERFPLFIKTAVAAGSALRAEVGDPLIQRLDVLAGPPVLRAALAEACASGSEVIVDGPTAEAIADDLRIDEWRQGPGGVFAIITDLRRALSVKPWEPLEIDASDPRWSLDILRPWILKPIYARLVGEHDVFLAELRRCNALFVRFSGLGGEEDGRAELDVFVRWVQSVLRRFGGHLIQLTIGEKGSYFYACFGAPNAHENDPVRAVSAALELAAGSSRMPGALEMQIGVAQGLLRAGAYGGPERRTYGVLGDAANTAARLMARAAPGEVLTTAEVYEATSSRYSFVSRGKMDVKGKAEQLEIWAVDSPVPSASRPSRRLGWRGIEDDAEGRTRGALGRDEEREIIAEAIEETKRGEGALIIFEGESGMGKTTMADEAALLARLSDLSIHVGSGDAVEKDKAYHAWRGVFQTLVQPEESASLESLRVQILERLPDRFAEYGPLLTCVLPLPWPETEVSRGLYGEARAELTRELLLALLEQEARAAPTMIILEDAHWFDSASWGMAHAVSLRLPGVMLLITTRPQGLKPPPEYAALKAHPRARIIPLSPLDERAIEGLVNRTLGTRSHPPKILRFIMERAEGHPFFAEELASMLREAGVLRVEGGRCQLAEVSDPGALEFPETIQGLVTSRLDALSSSQLLTLKTAGIIGRVFSVEMLRAIHPSAESPELIAADLEALNGLGLLVSVPASRPRMAFKHAMIQVAVVQLMLARQRRTLHRSAAQWLEERSLGATEVHASRLAHHWRLALEPSKPDPTRLRKAIHYLAAAGEQAHVIQAHREAEELFSKLLELEALQDPPQGPLGRARWQRRLGEAYFGLGQYERSREHLEKALALMGFPAPVARTALLLGIIVQALVQLGQRLRAPAQSPDAEQDRLIESVAGYRILSNVHILNSDLPETLFATLRCLNLAQLSGPSTELAVACASMAVILSAGPLPGLARHYIARARALIEEVPFEAETPFIHLLLGIYHFQRCEWESCAEELDSGRTLAEQLAYHRRWEECSALMAFALGITGRAEASRGLWDAVYRSGLRRGDRQPETWAVCGLLETSIRTGRAAADEAILRALERARDLVETAPNRLDRIRLAGLIAHLDWRSGERTAAVSAALQGAAELMGAEPSLAYGYEGWTGVAIVLMAAWELQVQEGHETFLTRKTLQESLEGARRPLTIMADRFLVTRARVALVLGREQWILGRRRAADKIWRRGLQTASDHGLAYDEALLMRERGRRGLGEEGLLAQARVAFEQIGAAYDARLCDAAQAGSERSGARL